MWPVHIHYSIIIRKKILASITVVSAITSDGESYLGLQPFVAKIVKDDSEARLYRVTERVPAPFDLWKMNNSFEVRITPIEDQDGRGMDMSGKFDMSFFAPKFESKVRVKETGEPGVVEVTEIMNAEVFSLMAVYITGLMEYAHQVLLDRLAERVGRDG
ncbi:hypothetical protein AN958_02103 [Leucoagaricus sp. SymC.cos]|nr:hypothetical protein AN958_02103 [Leucoagaricus sp. SymC.cos]